MVVNGYETKTTFWQDFSIADCFGIDAVKDTYERAFDEWHTNIEYITELTLVLNWKCWDLYSSGNIELSKVYADLYHKNNNWCYENLEGTDMEYYFNVTD